MPEFEPAYLQAYSSGLLRRNLAEARARMASCTLCPRMCRVDRLSGETGVCRTGRRALVSSFNAHFGEEAPLVGANGSGTIFFTHCNLLCLFCQNFEISHEGIGEDVSDEQLAGIMLALQRQGCHNINFVTPSHVVSQILAALELAVPAGLKVPLVYNSGGYDRIETLRLLDGVIDIYMPDFKFWDADVARDACNAPDYPETARQALLEMHRQVGDLELDDRGIARRGLLVRHLVMPGGLAGTREIMRFIAQQVSSRTYVNVMSQYRPCGRAHEVSGLEAALSADEYRRAVREAIAEGITRLDQRQVFFRRW
ncbi:MAG: radical SAM protein [Desulfobacterales bacterium]|jgi:putative pyruvate formate lyase activating enzyme|nr:radical SAM protein [Desulfobacterales bacterium]